VRGAALEQPDDEPASQRGGQRGYDDVDGADRAVSCGDDEVDAEEANDCPAEECCGGG
jgi:hypothetical protein